jgi:hypothetical protein
MYNQKVIDRQQFSLCFRWEPDAQVNAGVMVLGGTDDRLHHIPISYAKEMEAHASFWQVEVRKVYLAERQDVAALLDATGIASNRSLEEIPIDGISSFSLRPIVDSGTTYTYLNNAFEEPLRQAWEKATGREFANSICYMSEEQVQDFPTFFFQLKGVENNELVGSWDEEHPNDILVAFPPSRYLEKSGYCFRRRLYFESGRGVLGANFISGHDVHFDMDNNRIGFAESQCPSLDDNPSQTAPSPSQDPSEMSKNDPSSFVSSSGSRTTCIWNKNGSLFHSCRGVLLLFLGATMSFLESW